MLLLGAGRGEKSLYLSGGSFLETHVGGALCSRVNFLEMYIR